MWIENVDSRSHQARIAEKGMAAIAATDRGLTSERSRSSRIAATHMVTR